LASATATTGPASAGTGPLDAAGARVRPAPVFAPLYKQIQRLLLEGLKAGEWKPGAVIPSETELASRYQVSQGTVRKAIDDLVGENLLVRRQGKGTFVATHHAPHAQYRFLRLLPDSGEPRPARSRFLECRRQRAPADVAARLGLRAGASVVLVRRLLTFGEAPVVHDEIWLPARLFRGLTFDRLASYTGPLYGLFETEFGVAMVRADERLRAVLADARNAELLRVDPGSPLLLVERLSFTWGDRPVELRRGLCLTRDHYYHNSLT
jgi:GntR family transcriptional regulator